MQRALAHGGKIFKHLVSTTAHKHVMQEVKFNKSSMYVLPGKTARGGRAGQTKAHKGNQQSSNWASWVTN